MKLNHAVAVLMFWVCIFAASGSAFAQRLYPVEGPIASQTPQPVFKGHISHPIFGVSPLFMLLRSWTVANGEVLQGKPKKVKASSVNNPVPSASAPPQPNLAFAWDAVYGPGYFVGHILGKDMESRQHLQNGLAMNCPTPRQAPGCLTLSPDFGEG
jgi:hypothetical protein